MPYEPIETLIPNTIMKKVINSSGRHTQYSVEPIENYILHDNRLDTVIFDDETGDESIQLGYAEGDVSVRYDYDFNTVVQDTITDSNGNAITVNKIGAFELYAIPRDSRPPDSYISGNDEPEHEVMSETEETEEM